MYFANAFFVTILTLANLAVPFGTGWLECQNATNAQKVGETSDAKTEETKGEVDLLLKALKKRSEPVLRRCFEKCPESKKAVKGNTVSVGQTINKVQPNYPGLARAAHASGEVVVMIVVDEEGKVMAAQVVSGHPLLHATCLKAARESTFSPTLIESKAVKVLGTITYRFVSL